MGYITDSGLLYVIFFDKKNKDERVYVTTPYYANDDIINASFKESLTIPHLLQTKGLISIGNTIAIDLNHVYAIFRPNSVFIEKHVASLVAAIKTHHKHALVAIPNLLINSRAENPNCPCNSFPKKQLEPHNQNDTHFVAVYYDEVYNVMRLISGTFTDHTHARKWVFSFTMQKDEWSAINCEDIICNFLSKTFPETIITNSCFEPDDIWIAAHGRICALLKMTLMRKIINVSYTTINAELDVIKEKKEKILAAQAIESRKDETIPENLPNLSQAINHD